MFHSPRSRSVTSARATISAPLTLAAAAAVLLHATSALADAYAGGPGHSSALLPDGAVVVSGGDGLDGAPSSATILYRAGLPQPTGPLATPRSHHTATSLFDGRILVAGGTDGTGPLASLELYDPLTGTFTQSNARLAVARQGHTAVGLADGRVLVRGGRGAGGQEVTREELYDPRADAVQDAPAGLAIASLSTDRADYLPGDTVYVSGAGWQPGESVDLLFDEEPLVHAPVVIRTVADANGDVQEVASYHVDDADLGTTFTLHAVGASSTTSADVVFTDGANLQITQQPPSVSLVVGQTIAIGYRVSAKSNTKPLVTFTNVKVTISVGGGLQKVTSDPAAFSLGPDPTPWAIDLVVNVKGTSVATGNITISVTGTPSTSGYCSSGGSPCSDTKTIGFTVGAPPKTDQTIAFGALADKTYGDPPFTVDATASSGLPVSFSASGNCAVSGNTVTLGNVGTCSITASQSGNDAYFAAADVTRSFDITRAPLTITANDATMVLHGTVPPLTASYSGFVLGEDPAVLGGSLSCTTTATSASDVGAYPITCSGQSSGNYALTYVGGTLKVLYASAGACLGDVGHTILQPINANGTSVWRTGRTVPAKFRVCDAAGVSIGGAGVVTAFSNTQRIGGTTLDVNEGVESTTADTWFRWDPAGQQWIFNISTASLGPNATYVYEITLKDGTTIPFRFGLR